MSIEFAGTASIIPVYHWNAEITYLLYCNVENT